MIELKIEISEDLKQQMSEMSMIDWTSIIAAFIREKMFEWKRMHSAVESSELTEDDSIALGRKINMGLAKRYKEKLSIK